MTKDKPLAEARVRAELPIRVIDGAELLRDAHAASDLDEYSWPYALLPSPRVKPGRWQAVHLSVCKHRVGLVVDLIKVNKAVVHPLAAQVRIALIAKQHLHDLRDTDLERPDL